MTRRRMTRQEMRGHLNEAEDIAQLLEWERGFAKCGLAHDDTGKPPFEVLMYQWWRARNLTERVMLALPPGPMREELAYLLEERDEAMEAIRAKAREIRGRML
jgi:hypothetical protein